MVVKTVRFDMAARILQNQKIGPKMKQDMQGSILGHRPSHSH